MKTTLIIHPTDISTTFLENIYQPIKNKVIINGGMTKNDIRNIIPNFDKILLCGHGSPYGLLSVGQFGNESYIIDGSMVELLRGKELISIWCNANMFVEKYRLKGFSTSMFCSEYSECNYVGVKNVKKGMVESSNEAFASIMSKYIDEDIKVLHEKVTNEYGVIGESNPVAEYNNERILLF